MTLNSEIRDGASMSDVAEILGVHEALEELAKVDARLVQVVEMRYLLIALWTVLSGIGDAQGFIHAGRVWQDGRIDWSHALKSAAGFQFGVVAYWFALRSLAQYGIVAVEIQTLFWFGATIIGIAILSGKALSWPAADQVVAGAVLLGIGWLLYRTAR